MLKQYLIVVGLFHIIWTTSIIQHQNHEIEVPEKFFIDNFVNTANRKITLQDGRQVLCKTPIPPSEGKQRQSKLSTYKLDEGSALIFLINLIGICASMRTKVFIWEYCNMKFAKQYDDKLTIRNANKVSSELFYLGFHPLYDQFNQNFTEKAISMWKPFVVREFIPKEKFIVIKGHVARIFNEQLQQAVIAGRETYKLIVLCDWKFIKDFPDTIITENGLTLQSIVYSGKFDAYSTNQGRHIEIHREIVLASTHGFIFLKTPLPYNLVTTQYKIRKIEKGLKGFSLGKLLFSSFYLYGEKVGFLNNVKQGDALILYQQSSRETEIRYVYKIWDDNLIELDSQSVFGKQVGIREYSVLQTNGFLWENGPGKISIQDNIVIGTKTSFLKNVKKGNKIRIDVFNQKQNQLFQLDFVVYKVISDEFLIFQYDKIKFVTISIVEYFIGYQSNQLEQVISPKNNKDTDYIYDGPPQKISTSFTRSNVEGIICHSDLSLLQQGEGLIKFSLKKQTSYQKQTQQESQAEEIQFSLQLILSEEQCSEEGIELLIVNNAEIYVKNTNEKSLFAELDQNYRNQSLENYNQLWITVYDGVLRLGYSDEIRLSRQLLEFRSENIKNVKFINIKKKHSFNIFINNLQIMKLTQKITENLKKLNQIQIDFDLIDSDKVEYLDPFIYKDGSFCEDVNEVRSMEVLYTCSSSNSLLTIENIEELKKCHYRFTIGTNLFCRPQNHQNYAYQDKVYCEIDVANPLKI